MVTPKRLLGRCMRGGSVCPNKEGDTADLSDPFLWSVNTERHFRGRFSYAAVSGNEKCEDFSQVEVNPGFTFIGIYDGHGGCQVSRLIAMKIYGIFLKNRNGTMVTGQGIRNTFADMEAEVRNMVRKGMRVHPLIKATGSCCLIGVLIGDVLYVANVGDSRAILGALEHRLVANCYYKETDYTIHALSRDDNANVPQAREEIQKRHPNDDNIVVMEDGAWRVKGLLQVTKSIGDMFMKDEGFVFKERDTTPELRRFCFTRPSRQPILSADPLINTRVLNADHRCVVFASDGLWDNLTEQEVCHIVRKHKPHARGVAEVLIRRAIGVAAGRRGYTYDQVKCMTATQRRDIHDDITVIVLFLDLRLPNNDPSLPRQTLRAFGQPREEWRSSEWSKIVRKGGTGTGAAGDTFTEPTTFNAAGTANEAPSTSNTLDTPSKEDSSNVAGTTSEASNSNTADTSSKEDSSKNVAGNSIEVSNSIVTNEEGARSNADTSDVAITTSDVANTPQVESDMDAESTSSFEGTSMDVASIDEEASKKHTDSR